MEFRTIHSDEIPGLKRLWAVAFGKADAAADAAEQPTEPDEQQDTRLPEGTFVAVEGGRPVSAVMAYTRAIYLAGQKVPMGGIGGVATLPEYRARGLSGRLLQMAIEYMDRQELPISMLFTGVHPHYARYGWFTVPLRKLRWPAAEPVPAGADIRPLTAADIPAARALYAQTAQAIDGASVRDSAECWAAWAGWPKGAPLGLWEGGRLAAWAVGAADAEARTLTIADAAAEPGTPRLAALVAAHMAEQPAGYTALVPAPLAPGQNGPFAESTAMMLRLNRPFTCGGHAINTAGKLARLAGDMLFWDVDGF